MKFKRALAMTLAATMSLGLLAGCSKSVKKEAESTTTKTETKQETKKDTKKEDKKVEQSILKVAAFEGGYGRQYWDAVVEQFQKDYPNVKVDLTISPKINDIVRPSLVAGDAPDYIYADAKLYELMLGDDALLPLDEVFNSPSLDDPSVLLKDKILPGFLDFVRPLDDGKIYAAPVNMSVLGMFYNKGLFDSKGWKAPETWEQFLALADEAKSVDRALFTYQGIYPIYNQFILGPMLVSGAGMEEANKILNYAEDAWEAPKVKEVLQGFEKIATNNLLLDGTVAMNHTQAQTAFLQGQALFIPCGTWVFNEMKAVEPEAGFEYGFIPAPKLNASDKAYITSNIGRHYIPKNAKNIEMAKEFMKYHYKAENVELKAKLTTAVMPVVGGVEIAKPYIEPAMYNALSAFEKYDAEALNYAYKVVPNVEVKVEAEFTDAINSLMNGDIDTDGWIERVKKANAVVRKAMLEE